MVFVYGKLVSVEKQIWYINLLYIFIRRNIIVTAYELIFSEENTIRIKRHLTFWLIFSFHFFIWNLDITQPADLEKSSIYVHSLSNLLFILPVCIFSIYISSYVLFQQFIEKNNYKRFLFGMILLNLLNISAAYILCLMFFAVIRHSNPEQISLRTRMAYVLNNGLWLPMTFSGLALGIKFAKNLYRKLKENERLEKLKNEAAFNLFRSQIQPRFFLRALETIYRASIYNSPLTPDLLLKLSDTLSYILYECNNEKILLEKELHMLKDYIALEKMKYQNRLDLFFDTRGNVCQKYITPLLLMHFVENSFGHFENCKQDKLYLNVTAEIAQNYLDFTLISSIALHTVVDEKNKSNISLDIENSFPEVNIVETSENDGLLSVRLKIRLNNEFVKTHYFENLQNDIS